MIRFYRSGASALLKTASMLAATALLAACSGHGPSAGNAVVPSGPNQNQSANGVNPNVVTNVYGGGGTLAAILYRNWEDYYGVALPPDPQGAGNGLPVNPSFQYYYQPIGSGGGQVAFLSQTPSSTIPSTGNPESCPNGGFACIPYPNWSYSGSDATFSSAQISCYQVGGPCGSGGAVIPAAQPARGQYFQIPTLETPITFAYDPSGQSVPAGGLRLSRNSYCGIWEGAIANWGDPGITADNGGVQVSTQAITRVVRSDGSGTTFLLTNHLNTVCQGLSNPTYDWTAGAGTAVTWPGTVTAVSGSSGVASTTQTTAGAIGYVGPSYVLPVAPAGPPTILLQNQYAITNHVTQFRGPTIANTSKAFKSVGVPTNPDPFDLALLNPNPIESGAYPVVGFTWLEAYQCYSTSTAAVGVKDIIKWYALTGTTTPANNVLAAQGFAPLNKAFKAKIRSIANSIVKGPVSGVCTI
jgi:ABC-type phosphate transport system substrate-binding protein